MSMNTDLKENSSNKYDTYRILAKDCFANNNTRITGLNNNDLIIGPSGAGKTRGYVKPNIMQCNESMIIADTKGNLIKEVGPIFKNNGYKLINMNFKDLSQAYGYNPLDYIRYDKKNDKYSEQDIMTVASTLIPSPNNSKDPFWELAAKMYLTCMIAYIMECLPPEEHTLEYAVELTYEMTNGNFRSLITELKHINPNSLAVKSFKLFENNYRSEKTEASIIAILGEKLNGLNFDAVVKMYSNQNKINFKNLGREKTVVFLTISDTDRSMDRLISLFYTQALHELCNSADTDYDDNRLPVPVRFILDDFATNAYIPDFENIISVIRSREIYVSIILQSITQLTALYGDANAKTIINNCDNCLYLGGQDIDTARYISLKANKTINTVLDMPLNEALLFTRGQAVRKVEKYDIKQHERYCELPEYSASKPDKTQNKQTDTYIH